MMEATSLLFPVIDEPSSELLKVLSTSIVSALARDLAEIFEITGFSASSAVIGACSVSSDAKTVYQTSVGHAGGVVSVVMTAGAIERLVSRLCGGLAGDTGSSDAASPNILEAFCDAVMGQFIRHLPGSPHTSTCTTAPAMPKSRLLAVPILLDERDCCTLIVSLKDLAVIERADGQSGRRGDESRSWSTRLNGALAGVRIQLRLVLARPVLTAAELAGLKPGAVIPLPRPTEVLLIAGGYRLGSGVVTESEGRARITINRVEV